MYSSNDSSDVVLSLQSEIGRLQMQHQELLLKGAHEQNELLNSLEQALKEIERLKTDQARLIDLLVRAAAALADSLPLKEYATQFKLPRLSYYDLIDELRKAAE